MANEEHLAILEKGVKVWNKWRVKNPFVRPTLHEVDLSGASLCGANLRFVDLIRANLMGADLRGAILKSAKLFEANLIGANLEGTILIGVELRGADLIEAKLGGAEIGYTDLYKVNLSSAIGLDECKVSAPCFIDHQTLRQSRNLPTKFLRGIGLTDIEIEQYKLYDPDLSNEEVINITYRIADLRAHQAIQINPLFISYNHKDAAFVDALEKYLLEKGIRFWRDIHHGVSGRLEKQVDRAMRLHPTVLLVLSEHSIESDWVEHEAESARELEKELKRDVLCPVALDDSWKDARWDKRLRRQIEKYNVLPFHDWKEGEVFKRQFGKLLSGLDLFYKK